MRSIVIILTVFAASIMIAGCSMPQVKKRFISKTDSLISVLKESDALTDQLKSSFDSLNTVISKNVSILNQPQKRNDSIAQIRGHMKKNNKIKIKNLGNLKTQIEFATPDLEKFRKNIPLKNITAGYIADYLHHASLNIEAISIRLSRMEGYCQKQKQELFSLNKYIENDVHAVNKP